MTLPTSVLNLVKISCLCAGQYPQAPRNKPAKLLIQPNCSRAAQDDGKIARAVGRGLFMTVALHVFGMVAEGMISSLSG